MNMKILLVPAALAAALTVQGCSRNYAVEGAAVGAAAGAGIGAVTGGDVGTSAAIGAAAGAAGGSLIRKDGKCYRVDNRGREYQVSCN